MRTTFALLIATVLSSMGAEGLPRVVSAAGAITEAVYALGSQDRLVAVDTSSVYPTEALELPQVGYARQLAAEGILSVHPTLLLITDDAGPPNVLAQVEKAGVRIVRLTNGHTPDAAEQRIRVIGEELGKPTEAKALIASMHVEVSAAPGARRKCRLSAKSAFPLCTRRRCDECRGPGDGCRF